MFLTKMYITNNPQIAKIAENNGVDIIWIDLEILGKIERQKGRNTVISRHLISDISPVKRCLSRAKLLVRVNPWNCNSGNEIEQVINAGADIIMLPMWRKIGEVQKFIECVNGRVRTVLLLETYEATQIVDEVLKLEGLDEIYIGLNDLHISMHKTFMFELLADGTVETLCNKIKNRGISYGFGGIAKIGDGLLPAEKILAEHYRLGSTRVILSRTFCDNAKIDSLEEIERVFNENMLKINNYEKFLLNQNEDFFIENQNDVKLIVENVVEMLKETKTKDE